MEPRAMDSDKDSVRLRAACDRCHSQKLRCPKPAGAEVCDRCQRAGRPCVFSPFRQKKEPGRAHEKASMNTQLFHLEEKIDSMTEKRKRSLVGVKRKRNTLTPPRDCGAGTQSPPTRIYPSMDLCLSFPEGSGPDWTCDSFPLNEFGMDTTFDELNLEFGDSFQPLNFNSPEIDWGNCGRQGQKSMDLIQFQNSSMNLLESNTPAALSVEPLLGSPQPPLWNNQPLRFEWEKQIRVTHPDNHNPERNLIRQLSELSVDLYDHMSSVPPQSIHDPIPEGTDLRAEKHTGYSVDETFRLTQELIDVYPNFINTFFPKRSCRVEESSPSTPESSDTSPPAGSSPSNNSHRDIERAQSLGHQDHASILLLLSCHLRIIDIYGELFKHMIQCINAPSRKANFRQAMYMPPVIKIGAYTAPSSAAVPMQMILLLQQACRLSEYASELAAHLKGSQDETERIEENSARGDAAILSLVTAEKVTKRALNMSQQLNSVKTHLMNPNFSDECGLTMC